VPAYKDDPVLGGFVVTRLLTTRRTTLATVATVNSNNVRDNDSTCDNYEAYNLQQLRPNHVAYYSESHGNRNRQKAPRPHPIPPHTIYLVEASHDSWRAIHFLGTFDVRPPARLKRRLKSDCGAYGRLVRHDLFCFFHS
jgi:hypothetical protein